MILERTFMETSDAKSPERPSTSSRPLSERFGLGYIRETLEWFTGKGRKKDKGDGSSETASGNSEDYQKGYLKFSSMQQFTRNYQLRELIPVPNQIDSNEWLATHVIPFFHHVNLLYGAVSEYCTAQSCPVMTAPKNTIYPWIDDKGRKSKCSAPQYIDLVTASIEKLINDDTNFPSKYGQTFPPNFEVVVRRIMRQLFHVLAHLYHQHFDQFVHLGIHLYLNGLFAHFILFGRHFNLLEARELEVLSELVDKISNESDSIAENEPPGKTSLDLSKDPVQQPPVESTVSSLQSPINPEEGDTSLSTSEALTTEVDKDSSTVLA